MKRRKRCEDCKKLREDVKKVIDPYQEDIYGVVVMRWLCPQCAQDLCDDI